MRKIGKISYDPKNIIGTGGFANVYEGLFEDVKRVAVKRFQKSGRDDEESTIKREADLMLKANEHPNILRYFCHEMNDDFVFIATELCAGTLQDYVEGRYVEPSLGDEKEILYQVTHGLTYLHALEIVHLDIKPTNILIFEPQVMTLLKPHVKLADFGLCKFPKSDKNDFTNSHRTDPQGTLGWMAPELYKSERYDSKVDLFPLGCIFGYTLSDGGKHPFGDEPAKRQNRIKQKPMLLKIEDLKQPYRDNPIGFQLIQNMVKKDPEDRPTALEVLNSSFFGQEYGMNMLKPRVLNHSFPQLPISTQISTLLPSKNEKFDSDLTMEFLRLCSIHKNISGDNLLRFKELVNDERVNVNKTDQSKMGPLDILCYNYENSDNNFFELIQLLLERDPNVNPKILHTLFGSRYMYIRDKASTIELVKIFIERGCDVNAKDSDGCTLFVTIIRSLALSNDDLLIDLFKILIDAGADVTAKDANGYTLLHWFIQWNRDLSSKIIDLIRYLIEKGIDVNARDIIGGHNPLHILCSLCTNEETFLSLVKIFKENGVDLKAETKQGKTACFILRFESFARLEAKWNIEKVIEELST